jgi:hypothetical protein
MVTVEYDPSGAVEMYCDQDGLELLVGALVQLKHHGGHVHLRTPAWAGDELSEQLQGTHTDLIHHLMIVLRPDDWTAATAQGELRTMSHLAE